MWWRTQRRIEMTSAKVSAQVKTAVADITHRVDSGLEGIETRVDAKLGAEGPDIASEVESAVNDALGAFNEQLGPTVSKHIEMALHQVEAQQAKRVGAFLKESGLDDQLEGLEEGLKQEALAAAGPAAQFYHEIMAAKIPKNATVTEKAWLTASKMVAVQMAQGGLGAMMPGGAAVQAAEPVSRGFGVR